MGLQKLYFCTAAIDASAHNHLTARNITAAHTVARKKIPVILPKVQVAVYS